MKIHISIVDYFKSEKVVSLLSCLERQSVSDNSITVVDNSVDEDNFKALYESMQNEKNASLVKQINNIGYTKATNISVDSSADYVVLINPDIYIEDDCLLEKCISRFSEFPDMGVLGVAQNIETGGRELIARTYPSVLSQLARRVALKFPVLDEKRKKYELSEINYAASGVYEVDWVQSSFWVVKGDLWRRLSGLSECYYLFMSEPDFSRRAKKIGYKTYIDCDVYVISDGIRASGVNLKSVLTSRPLRYHIIDAVKYYFKLALR